MAEIDIWMPWHIAEYLADTMHLSTLEHGAYLLILGHGWRNDGTIVAGDAYLAGITKLPKDQWKAIKPTIERFFEAFNHPSLGPCWRQKRQVEEILKAKAQKVKALEKTRNATDARRKQRDVERDVLRDDDRNVHPREGKGKDSLDLPPEDNSALGFRLPARSQEAVALGAQAARSFPTITQNIMDRALAVMAAYPSKAKKDGRPINKPLQAQNLLAARIAANPDYPWEEHVRLVHSLPMPTDALRWVEDMPNPIALESLRSASASVGISQAAASAPNFYANFDPEKA